MTGNRAQCEAVADTGQIGGSGKPTQSVSEPGSHYC